MTLAPIIPKRVVITGLGIVSPLGNTREQFWDSLKNGIGGIDYITKFDTSDFPTHIGAEVKEFDPSGHIDRKELRHMDLFTQYALIASIDAIEESKIDFDQHDRDRVGVIVGSGIGGMNVIANQVLKLEKRGPRKMSPFFIPMMISDIAAGHISIRYDLRGPNYSTTSACATSGHAIGCAMKAIRYGEADVMISGGTESPICPTGLGGFCAMKALSTNNENPQNACRPFDLKRDGFIMGEGAGIVVLEAMEHALERGANIYGELTGVGFSADAHHITAPPEDGHGAVNAMRTAIRDSGIQPDDIDYINAHGTSTPLNDLSETRAIKTVFGDRASQISISSTKSMHGHLLGAAGAVEMISALLAIKNQTVPPTINYEYPDPECDLDYTPNQAVNKSIDYALSNTFGFGGHNACLIVKRYS